MMTLTLIIFFATFAWLATERHPRYVVALGGALAMILCRIITPGQAWRYVNWGAIATLFILFIIAGILLECGFFDWVGARLVNICSGHPVILFFSLPLLAAFLSTVLNNIAVMLVLSLLTLEICQASHLNPALLITAEVCAANAGGGATLIGSPPNLLMGTAMGYSFTKILANMGPLSGLSVGLILLVLYCIHRKALPGPALAVKKTRWKRLPAGLLLKAWRRLDWRTLLFFIGLFVLVGALDQAGVFHQLAQSLLAHPHKPLEIIFLFLGLSAAVSALVDNIPMALSMAYLIKDMHGMPGAPPEPILVWAALIGLTLGGNLTPIGASPNVVAYGVLERAGRRIGWKQWVLWTGPSTLVALIGVTFIIWLKYSLGWY